MQQFLSPMLRLISLVPPEDISFCTPESEWTDVNQSTGNPNHPHAGQPRGYFSEQHQSIRQLTEDWDRYGPAFRDLDEYRALENFINASVPWSESVYAQRAIDWVKSGQASRGFNDPVTFLAARQLQIEKLIQSVRSRGVNIAQDPANNISVNVTRDGVPLFNNRGHHRLAVAQCLRVEFVPVQLICFYNASALETFLDKYSAHLV